MIFLISQSEAIHSDEQREALIDFYSATGGTTWRNNSNWGIGDPCLNHWFGVMCQDDDRIVSLL